MKNFIRECWWDFTHGNSPVTVLIAVTVLFLLACCLEALIQ